jgi:hypothetical protein
MRRSPLPEIRPARTLSILLLLTFLLLPSYSPLSSVENPRNEKSEKTESESEDKNTPRLSRRDLPAEVALCDGRTLKGRVELELPDAILFTHTVEGLEFIKKVRLADIRSIEFERWTPVEQGKGKDGRVFRFDVSRFRVEASDSTLIVQKPLPAYMTKLKFSNRNGDVLLYSFWMDLLKADNSWYTGIQGSPSGERAFCHKDVLKKIIFVK